MCRSLFRSSGELLYLPPHGGSLARRVTVLPLVCKRWAHILGQPSAVWADMFIDLQEFHKRDDDNDGRPFLDARVMSSWFSR